MRRIRLEMNGDGRVFEGSPVSIVEEMRSLAFHGEISLEGYIEWASEMARIHFGLELAPKGDNLEALAESFIASISRSGLARETHIQPTPE